MKRYRAAVHTSFPAAGLDGSAAPRRLILGAVLAVLAAVGVLGTWWFFVTTATGQRLDEHAYIGSRIGRGRLAEYAQAVLEVVSVPFLIVVILIAGGFALMRRRWGLALGVALVVGMTNVTTQILKYYVFTRPDLGISEATMNSLPSGHTTVAASVVAAALLVAPVPWRGMVAVLGGAYAGATGIATMVDGWHRASDVVAAVLVAAVWGILAQAIAAATAEPRAQAGQAAARAATSDHVAALASRLLILVGLGAAMVAGLSLAITRLTAADTRSSELIAYGGASAGVVAVTCAVMLAMLLVGVPSRRR